MLLAHPDDEPVAIHADVDRRLQHNTPDTHSLELTDVARVACAHRATFTAVVGADDHVVLAFVGALREARVDPSEWPDMVGFENLSAAADYSITSVRPRWDEMGAEAAELLWQRHSGRLDGPPQVRVIPMDVIARPALSGAAAGYGADDILLDFAGNDR